MKASLPPPHIASVMVESFIQHSLAGFPKMRTKGALLTWMVPKTMVHTSMVTEKEPTTLCQVVRHLRASPEAQELWKDILLHVRHCLQLAGGVDVSVCLEVCPDTWKEKREVQLHFHAFLKSSVNDLRIRNLTPFAFKDVKAHVTTAIGGLPVNAKGRMTWAGFFYCCIHDKTGTVFSEATRIPFKNFLVQPNWILNLVQSQKLETDVAKMLLVQCVNASRHIRELDLHAVHLEEIAVKKAHEEAIRLLSTTIKPSRKYPEVERFVEQFATPLHRYNFLVLSGPSQVGKTGFARSLCDPALQTLEINCASGAEPDLRAYRLSKHDVIFFDEIAAEQVAHQRKLFQAQRAPVQLGCSATNCHSYEVFVWKKKLVLASNNWEASLQQLSAADQAWIQANSIVLCVTEIMYEA